MSISITDGTIFIVEKNIYHLRFFYNNYSNHFRAFLNDVLPDKIIPDYIHLLGNIKLY